MSSAPKRLFKPLLENPLHGGTGISSERVLDGPSASTSPLLPNPVIPQHLPGHGTPIKDTMPACSTNNVAHEPTAHNLSFPPISPTVPNIQVLPAFFFISNQQGQSVAWTAPLFPKAGSSLDDVTRANLIPLMISKGFIAAPPGWTVPLSHSSHSQHHSMSHATGIHIQPSSSSSATDYIINESEDEWVTTPHEPVTSTDDSSTYETEPLKVVESIPPHKQTHVSRPHSHTYRRQKTRHSPTATGKSRAQVGAQQQQRRERIAFAQLTKNNFGGNKHDRLKPISKLEFIKWATALDSLWYLLEQNKYTQDDHERLIELLREIDDAKRRSVDLKILKETKLVECLKKFKKEESLFQFDPWVRHTSTDILRFWKAQFDRT